MMDERDSPKKRTTWVASEAIRPVRVVYWDSSIGHDSCVSKATWGSQGSSPITCVLALKYRDDMVECECKEWWIHITRMQGILIPVVVPMQHFYHGEK